MDIKIIFSFGSLILTLIGMAPYLRDIVRGNTKPHMYSWLVWSITQSTGALGAWYGGGGLGAINVGIGAMMNILILGLSFRYGTKNIKNIDAIMLVGALAAIIVWWQLNNPVAAVLMACAIDVVGGYFPSFRKSYEEPWSETVGAWLIFILAIFLAILALTEYNILTLSYLITIGSANLILALICIFRRNSLPKSS